MIKFDINMIFRHTWSIVNNTIIMHIVCRLVPSHLLVSILFLVSLSSSETYIPKVSHKGPLIGEGLDPLKFYGR